MQQSNLKLKVINLLDRRFRFMYAKIFEIIEKKFPKIVITQEWVDARNEILNLSNSIIRANREDLTEFDIIQKSIHYDNKKNEISFSKSIFYLINRMKINFDNMYIDFIVPEEKKDLLVGLLEELKCGEIITKDNITILRFDRNSILQSIDIFDRLPLKADMMEQYINFRKRVVNSYWLDVKECSSAKI